VERLLSTAKHRNPPLYDLALNSSKSSLNIASGSSVFRLQQPQFWQ